MLKRKRDGAATAELVVVATDPSRFGGLPRELDADFGGGGWIRAEPQQVPGILEAAGGGEAAPTVLVCAGPEDMSRLDTLLALVTHCARRGAVVIVVVDEIAPVAVHRLMRAGATDFLPTPLATSHEHAMITMTPPRDYDLLLLPLRFVTTLAILRGLPTLCAARLIDGH